MFLKKDACKGAVIAPLPKVMMVQSFPEITQGKSDAAEFKHK